MIVNAFKNEMFPIAPDDVPPYDGDAPPRNGTFSTSDKSDFAPDDLDRIHIGNADDLDESLLDTDKYLDPDLIEKYFFNKSLKKCLNF